MPRRYSSAVGRRWAAMVALHSALLQDRANPRQQTRHFKTHSWILWTSISGASHQTKLHPQLTLGFFPLNLCFVHDGSSEALPVWRRGSESLTPSCARKPATLLWAPRSKGSKDEGGSQHDLQGLEIELCSRPPSMVLNESPARVRLAVFRNGALGIGASSILN
jgi:hypothetical protein